MTAMIVTVATLVRYRNCAEELRTLAHDNHTVENREALFRLAEAYEQMANSVESVLNQRLARRS